MGNQTYVSSKRKLHPKIVDGEIREINSRRFDGYFPIEFVQNECWTNGVWFFSCPEFESPLWHFELSDTGRKIQGGHPRPGFQWLYWSQSVFHHELGVLWGGRISDDGVPGTWAPEKNCFSTFSDWQQRMQEGFPCSEVRTRLQQIEREELPEALRKYL